MNLVLSLTLLAFAGALLCAGWLLAAVVRERGRRWIEGFDTQLGAGLRQSFLYIQPQRLLWMNLGVAVALGVFAEWVLGAGLALPIALLAAGVLPSLVLHRLQARRRARLMAQWPEAVMLVAGALSAGAGLTQALRQVAHDLPAPVGQELELLLREHRLGVSLDQALQHLEIRLPMEGVQLFAAALRIAQESGGNLSETLTRLSTALRRKAEIEGRIDALTAQGRLQGVVMSVLPLVLGGALLVIDPEAMRPLFATWQGAVVCGVVVVLLGLGWVSILRIVRIDV